MSGRASLAKNLEALDFELSTDDQEKVLQRIVESSPAGLNTDRLSASAMQNGEHRRNRAGLLMTEHQAELTQELAPVGGIGFSNV